MGENTITVKVTAEDKTTEKTYTLTVNRSADTTPKSDDATLSGLKANDVTIFLYNRDSYTLEVKNEVTSVNITATTRSNKAKLKINNVEVTSGEAYEVNNLNVGDNVIPILVTAEDNTTEETFTLIVKRAKSFDEMSDDATLSGLTVDGNNILDKVNNYTLDVNNDVTSVNITAVTSNEFATIKIKNENASINTYKVDAKSGEPFEVENLCVGDNNIVIEVTAENGKKQTYTFIVNAAPYDGPGPSIPQTPKAYYDSEYVQAAKKAIGSGSDIIVLNMDGTLKKYDSDQFMGVARYEIPKGLNNVKSIKCSKNNVMALKEDGTVVVWGYNVEKYCNVPDNVKNVTSIAATNNSFLALKEDGTVVAWGDNSNGLCDIPEGLTGVIDIDASNHHYLALKKDGTVVAWGNNGKGQCNVPSDLNDVACIHAVSNLSMAVKKDGTVVVWGDNGKGQCNVPSDLNDVVYATGTNNTCAALKANGTVVVWGSDGDCGSCNIPAGLHDVVSVCVSGNSIYAIKKDGTVAVWGYKKRAGSINPQVENLIAAKNVIAITPQVPCMVCREGTLEYYWAYQEDEEGLKALFDEVNVLSGHHFAVNNLEMLNSNKETVTEVKANEAYKINTKIDNYYCEDVKGNVIIQVRGGEGANAFGGGKVVHCCKQEINVPVVEGTTVSTEFNMPEDISGSIYVDVFVWDAGERMVPRTAAESMKAEIIK